MKLKDDLHYTKTHEWVKLEDNIAIVGITDYAQESLGSVVYVEGFLDDDVKQFEVCGAVESVKAASDICAPLSGKIIEVNPDVSDNPELLNDDPYTNWILKIEFDNAQEVHNLLDVNEYKKELH